MSYVNDVIASCAFGFAVDSLQDPNNVIFKLGQKAVVQDTTQVMKFFGYENMKTIMKVRNLQGDWLNPSNIYAGIQYSILVRYNQ